MNKVQKGQADMVICRRCRQEQSADERYCINCGDPLLKPARKSGGSPSGSTSGGLKNSQQWKPKPVSPGPVKNSAGASQGAALGSLVEQQQRKHIRRARAIIILIAVLLLFGSFMLYLFVGSKPGLLEIMKNSLEMDHNTFNLFKKSMTIEMWVNFFMGVFFLLFFIWARSNPYAAILTVLVIFITQIIVQGAMYPQSLVSPAQIFNVIIILALIRGIKAGLAYNKGKRPALQKR